MYGRLYLQHTSIKHIFYVPYSPFTTFSVILNIRTRDSGRNDWCLQHMWSSFVCNGDYLQFLGPLLLTYSRYISMLSLLLSCYKRIGLQARYALRKNRDKWAELYKLNVCPLNVIREEKGELWMKHDILKSNVACVKRLIF